ncbi:MAG: hypothetical protein ACRD0G_18150 [Acidimicrobiales bacterium]
MPVPDQIVCVDCGGVCHRLTAEPEWGWAAGDLVVYRCADCNDRWDLIVDPDDLT